MTKAVVIVAYHFPPIQGSSGVHRTLAFTKYLPASGWQTAVLTVSPQAYQRVQAENLELVMDGTRVARAFALDTKRHLSLAGRYPRFLALPDRWQSWIVTGVLRGLWLIREISPAAIVSTYPIASAHVIGYFLHRLTGLPWLADFRDPMLQNTFPAEPSERRAFAWVEQRVFASAAAVSVTTPGCREFYLRRYPGLDPGRVQIIANGYDEDAFKGIDRAPRATGLAEAAVSLLHSGLLYQNDRNPECFLKAVAELLREGALRPLDLQITFRASGSEEIYGERIGSYGLGEIIRLEPPVSYRDALQEMLAADGLLVFQAASCNHQIPAKIYEYLYARKPILGITDPGGDTGRLLADLGIAHIAPLDDTAAIKSALAAFITAVRRRSCRLPATADIAKLSRRSGAAALAAILDEITSP